MKKSEIVILAVSLLSLASATPPTQAQTVVHGPVTSCTAYLATGRPHQVIRDAVVLLTTRTGMARTVNLTPRRVGDALRFKSIELERPALAPDAYKPNRIEGCEVDGRELILTTRSLAKYRVTHPRL